MGAEVAAQRMRLQADNARNLSSARTTRHRDAERRIEGADRIDLKLRIPADFGGTIRTLELTGTAMFTVAPNRLQPFVVRAAHAAITATGNAITVRAFEEDSSVPAIGADEGTVSVRPKDSRN
jgi:ferric-dicitrate binding protein FerR (iron transport regulator)